MFDIDDFQATNRDGGHAAGDDVLRRVAAVLAESVRLVDTVGRIGGDEFVLIAPGSAGMTVAQRVIDGIAALPAVAGRDVSVSAGVARFPADGADAEALIAAATEALDRARNEGRGSVARPRCRGGLRPARGAAGPAGVSRGAAASARRARSGRGTAPCAPGPPAPGSAPARSPRSAGTPDRLEAPCRRGPTVKPPSATGTPSAPITQAS